ncbi:MAG: ABC transporter permease [Gemmatimonadota bacterium]|nr:ABC transporter permease [Gemmatimonadota bacterium]
MTASLLPTPLPVGDTLAAQAPVSRFKVYATETKYELIKQMRIPAFMIPTIGFPIMFYVLFGLVMQSGRPDALRIATYMLATYGAFGVIGISLFALGVGVAVERGQGWLAVKRASPMPVSAYFTAKYVTTVVIGVILMLLISCVGILFGHVRMSAGHWLALFAVECFGAMPFCAMGLAIGYIAGPNSAAPTVNILYLPMAFLSGLFIPAEMLPKVLQGFAVVLPPYHLGQLAMDAVGAAPASDAWGHILALLGFLALFTIVAFIAYRRDEGKTYG